MTHKNTGPCACHLLDKEPEDEVDVCPNCELSLDACCCDEKLNTPAVDFLAARDDDPYTLELGGEA